MCYANIYCGIYSGVFDNYLGNKKATINLWHRVQARKTVASIEIPHKLKVV